MLSKVNIEGSDFTPLKSELGEGEGESGQEAK